MLFLTADIPGSADLPPAWRHRVHCQPRYHIAYFLQAWLEKPLNPPRMEPEPLLVIDFVRRVLRVRGVSLELPPRTMEVLAVLVKHHPQPLMAADIVQGMQEHTGRRASEPGVRSVVQSLRNHLAQIGLDRELFDSRQPVAAQVQEIKVR